MYSGHNLIAENGKVLAESKLLENGVIYSEIDVERLENDRRKNILFDTDENNNPIKGIPRHPIIGDNVVIYSNTSILGRIKVGANAVIGGNIWVTEDVAEGEKLVQAKANNILRFKQE